MRPCELWPLLKGRTFWFVGDSMMQVSSLLIHLRMHRGTCKYFPLRRCAQEVFSPFEMVKTKLYTYLWVSQFMLGGLCIYFRICEAHRWSRTTRRRYICHKLRDPKSTSSQAASIQFTCMTSIWGLSLTHGTLLACPDEVQDLKSTPHTISMQDSAYTLLCFMMEYMLPDLPKEDSRGPLPKYSPQLVKEIETDVHNKRVGLFLLDSSVKPNGSFLSGCP